jgi:hypothetical protein
MLIFKNHKENQEQVPTNDQESPAVDVPNPGAKKKVRSEKQREASRCNGKRSPGPTNTERTRYNALKHGLRAQGLTPWDNADEYQRNIYALIDRYDASDPVDGFVIQQLALEMVRMRRMDRLEADNIIAMSSPTDSSSDPSSDGTPTIHPAMIKEYIGPVLDTHSRYRTAGLNRLLRYRRELERIPRDEPSPESTKDIGQGDATDLASVKPSSKLPS